VTIARSRGGNARTADLPVRQGGPRTRSLERSVLLIVLVGGIPAVAAALAFTAGARLPEGVSLEWPLVGVVVGAWILSAIAVSVSARRALLRVADILRALPEGDYSIRGLRARGAMATVMQQLNDVISTLHRQRVEAIESTQLLTHVMEEIDVAVFAFDPTRDGVLLVNRAGERLMGRSRADLAGSPASALGLDEYLTGDSRRLVDRAFGRTRGRYEVRRATFYREGRPHQLIVIADLSQALREEEKAAWQRIVRVLSHEINNSLTPIKSIAHSLRRIVDHAEDFPRHEEVKEGLALIENRSGALGRFLRAYAQLARVPKPNPRPIDLGSLVRRVVELENRMTVAIQPSPDVSLRGDSDQLEQLLINVVRNAVDASLETGGGVNIKWKPGTDWIDIEIDDQGQGVPDKSNLFVPFFTTKPSGSGIGLALSRQIAEAHGGTITLENRPDGHGCRVSLRLPLRPRTLQESRSVPSA
jgi:two-component system, NtrC family, nitrogen regulation sensor histidine kinase NtrY